MKANELPINNFLQAPNVQFVIPVYQRNFPLRCSCTAAAQSNH